MMNTATTLNPRITKLDIRNDLSPACRKGVDYSMKETKGVLEMNLAYNNAVVKRGNRLEPSKQIYV